MFSLQSLVKVTTTELSPSTSAKPFRLMFPVTGSNIGETAVPFNVAIICSTASIPVAFNEMSNTSSVAVTSVATGESKLVTIVAQGISRVIEIIELVSPQAFAAII